jgi:hypothetical protein
MITSRVRSTVRADALLSSLTCDSDATHGWNAEVAPLLADLGRVLVTSPTRLTLTIPNAPAYEVEAPETVHWPEPLP